MGWKVWGDPWPTAESMQDASLFQTVQFNADVILRAARTWIIVFGNPAFTSLSMKIYSNDVVDGKNTPRKLLHTSTDVRTKAEIHTQPYAVREIYFNFGDVPIKGSDKYNFVINGVGYAPAGGSHLAWRKAFPDPVYASGYTPAIETINRAPYGVYFIGGGF